MKNKTHDTFQPFSFRLDKFSSRVAPELGRPTDLERGLVDLDAGGRLIKGGAADVAAEGEGEVVFGKVRVLIFSEE